MWKEFQQHPIGKTLTELWKKLAQLWKKLMEPPPDPMLSPISGEPVDGLFPEANRSKKAYSLGVHILVIALYWLWPMIPGAPQLPLEIQLPNLVFLVEPGPGGGGGGGGDNTPEPPSELKIEGEDLAKQAISVEDEDQLVFERTVEKPPEKEDPADQEPEEEEVPEIKAPIVAQAPDDVTARGELNVNEQLLTSRGPGAGNGHGEGEGPGIGPGYGGGFGGGAYRIGTGVEPPILRRQVRPSYTDEALARKIQGSVILEVVILKNGTVGPVRVIRSLGGGLDLKAIEAIRQWRFIAGKFQGKAVDVLAEVQVDFTLL